MTLGKIAAVVAALLVGVQVVRNAIVDRFAEVRPDTAAMFWQAHPAVEISRGLTEIGLASRERRPIRADVFAMIESAAVKAPLAPEPYLVRGVQAQLAGDSSTARRVFEAAQWRQPRSLPAAYFLTQDYFRTGDTLKALQQVTLLARLAPNGSDTVAPYIAAYGRDRSNWPELRALFREQPGLAASVLVALAKDARNVDAVLTLAEAEHRKPDAIWLRVLLTTLVDAGEYGRARAIWSAIGRGESGALIHDAEFASPLAPPPFNWSFTASTVGLAERQRGGRLHVIFYGNDDGVLAKQLLTLPAGSYRLEMRVLGSPLHPEVLRWSIRCDKTNEPLSSAAISQISNGLTFRVPDGCPAQWLELGGRSGDVGQKAEATIAGLRLSRMSTDG